MSGFISVYLRHCFRVFSLCALIACAAHAQDVRGRVTDASGAAIANAQVRMDNSANAVTDSAGSFVFANVPAGKHTLRVTAAGFAEQRSTITVPLASDSTVAITLVPASGREAVVVTASRTEVPLKETAESISVLGPMDHAPQISVDDALRQVPGFSLFRRTGSRFANPTALGAALRGVGASGASRTLVLFRDIPMNDPFGGWVYWGRVPREQVQRVEVLRGGGSDLYGSDALSGVVEVVPKQAQQPALDVEMAGGNLATGDGSLFAAQQWRHWWLSEGGEAFNTDGYINVPRASRGSADIPVDSRYEGGNVELGRDFSLAQVFLGASIYDDSRHNGTRLQTNSTLEYDVNTGVDFHLPAGTLAFRAFGGGETYHQSFSSIASDRNSELLTRLQRVPSQHEGGSAQWTGTIGRNLLLFGGDMHQVRGVSDELATSGVVSRTVSGGRQLRSGFFVRDSVRFEKWVLTLGGRVDTWQNYGAQQTRVVLASGARTVTPFQDRSDNSLNPRVSVLRTLTEHVAFTASGYRSFRAPTLNELYRSFRLGNVQTLANSSLHAEQLTGAEAGLNLSYGRGSARLNYFWADVTNPVANRTLSVTPALITRQRQNLGRLRSSGVEADAAVRIGAGWSTDFGYMFVNPSVFRFPADRTLEGKQVPQVPQHQFHAGLGFAGRSPQPAWMFQLDLRSASRQFDDDQNLLPLRSYAQVDGYLSRSVGRRAELFAAAENLLNRQYDIARTPLLTLGPPVQVRGGIRLHLSAR